MAGKCPKCEASENVIVVSLRVRDDTSSQTWPAVQFLCSRCRTILGVAFDPDWQSQMALERLKSISSDAGATH
jgi:hypothetical protein